MEPERKMIMGLNPNLFYATYFSSLVTASLGIDKFLKTGPCRLVPDQGPLGGYATLGFALLIFNIASTIVCKGMMMNPIIAIFLDMFEFPEFPKVIGVWLAFCYLPQLIYVSKQHSHGPKIFLLQICLKIHLHFHFRA